MEVPTRDVAVGRDDDVPCPNAVDHCYQVVEEDRDTYRGNDGTAVRHCEATWYSTTLEVPNDDGGILLRRGTPRREATDGVSCHHLHWTLSWPTGETFVGGDDTRENGAVVTSPQRIPPDRLDRDNQYLSLLPYALARDRRKDSWS